MDEVRIISKLMRGIISKLLSKAIKKNLNIDTNVQVNKFEASVSEEMARIHLDVCADLTKEELSNVLKRYGLTE